MTDFKTKLLNEIIKIEGGYSNDPADSGGETNFGITVKTARAADYHGPMETMPKWVAREIYSQEYWDTVGADEIVPLSKSVVAELVDTGVNQGPGTAVKILQRSINVLIIDSDDLRTESLVVDGIPGSGTVAAVKYYLSTRDEDVLLTVMNVLQGFNYIKLAERRKKDERFIYGWFKNRVLISNKFK